ncbi:hypothetical protein K3G63_21920, partial [Hymenobacter sp. HSC-4F20]|uniref:hypothetical protein n=1 Tax=Hymenobacter sp. HSC-4F20 TaxID=2864135 RepID=UPI001C731438
MLPHHRAHACPAGAGLDAPTVLAGRAQAGLRLDWELGRDVLLHLRGESFRWRGKAYSLAHSLVPAPDGDTYQRVVCHLLRSA